MNPLLYSLSPLSSKKLCTPPPPPQVNQFSEGGRGRVPTMSCIISSGLPKIAPILDILFRFLCWGIKLIISNQHHNFCYQRANNLGTTWYISINNAKSKSMCNFLFINFNTDNSCYRPLVSLTFLI